MLIQEPVQAAIWHCLNHYAYPDAIFLAERLRAEVESEDTLFLLATCYYRSGKPAEAYSILQQKGANSPQCKYLLAKCCLDLQKISEAEAALTGGCVTRCRSLDEVATEFGDSAAFALALIARVCYSTERKSRGAEAYKRALRINPFLWNSFEELCQKGEKPDPIKTFTLSSIDNLSAIMGSNPVINYINSHCEPADHNHITSTPTPVQNILNSTTNIVSGIRPFTPEDSNLPLSNMPLINNRTIPNPQISRNLLGALLSPLTPSFGVVPLDSITSPDTFMSPNPISLPPTTLTEANDQKGLAKRVSMSSHLSLRAHQLLNRKETPLQQTKPVFSQSGNTSHCVNNMTAPSSVASPPGPLHSAQNVRRSSRLFSNSYSVKENNKSPNRNKFATPKSPSRKVKSRISKANLNKPSYNELNERNRVGNERTETIAVLGEGSPVQATYQSMSQQAISLQKQSIDGLMLLLREVGTAYLHLTQFNCQKAIDCLNDLPQRQHNTGWVLCTLAKAYFELPDYKEAVKLFSRVRQMEPYRTQLMEIYSTALWHLQRESQLSALAQELVAFDRNSPVAWCAAGNCFSLQKEHDTAIKFFHRAVQVDPNFAYAYTLLGHEYVVTEELEKAMSCFRNAIRIQPRHYNAWYGIGTIYSKQERFQFAEIHFKRALQINPHSSILMCHIGVVQNALQKTDQALQTLNTAIEKDPQNPQCKFHRASIYFAAGRHTEALNELEQLKTIVPKESLVYYLTGKVHKKLGNTHLALMHFSWATDLDPKGANSQIKEAIDPTISRSHTEETADDFASEGNSALTQDASSQESPVLMQDADEIL